MSKRRENATSALTEGSKRLRRHAALANEMAQSEEARRAALNLMEDAVAAQHEAELAIAALQQSEARHAFLLMLSDELRTQEDPSEVQRIASRVLGEYLGASRVMYIEIGPGGDEAEIYNDYASDVPSVVGRHRLADFGNYVIDEFRRGSTVVVSDVSEDPRLTAIERNEFLTDHVRALVGVPLSKGGTPVSILMVHQSEPRTWQLSEISLVEEVAGRTRASVERSRAEVRMREAEERYRTLFDSIDQGFCTVEVKFDDDWAAVDYRFLECSPSFERQAGIGDPAGKWVRDVIPDQDQVWFEVYGRVALTGVPERFEEWSTPLGKWFSVYAFRVDDPSAHHVAILFSDITEQRRAETELRDTQERFKTAQQAGSVGVWNWEAENNATYWSETMWAIFGYSRPLDSAEKLWEKHLHPDDAERAVKVLSNTLGSAEDRYHDEFRIVGLDGNVRWIESVAQVSRDEKGGVIRLSGVNVDITDRRRAEQALRESEERLRLLTESFQDIAIFTTDREGNIVTWNPGAENIFGYVHKEIVGKNGRMLFVPEDQEKGEAEREMAVASDTRRAADERWHLRKDGSRFYASGIMAPLYDGGVLIGFAKIARDLTVQKTAEEELLRQHETLEEIVAGRTVELAEANAALMQQMERQKMMEAERVALLQKVVTTQEEERRRIARDMHDSLGQQLTALRLKIASMKTGPNQNGAMTEDLERLEEFGGRLDSEVNFLVWELRPTVLDDLGLVAAMESFVREWSRHYGIPAEVHTGRFGRGRLDPDVETNLYRILQEALNNIYKHAKASNVNVVLESRRGQAVLVIEDDGNGFDPDNARADPNSGRGLGLVGIRERAAIIDGRVEIESSPGKGTTVFVRVPVRSGE